MTRLERYQLSIQLRILEAVDQKKEINYAAAIDAVESGYDIGLNIAMDRICHDDEVLTEDECSRVWDIFDLFRAIRHTIARNKIDETSLGYWSKFQGFDGNHESKFLGFTRYTVETLFKYQELSEGTDAENYNSHRVMMPTYLAMLNAWNEIPSEARYSMSAEQLESVLRMQKYGNREQQ